MAFQLFFAVEFIHSRWLNDSPNSPVNLGGDAHLKVERLVLGQCCAQQLSPTLEQRKDDFSERRELVGFSILWIKELHTMHMSRLIWKLRINSTRRWRCHARLAHQTYHKQTFPYLEPFSQDFGAFRHDWIFFGHVLKMNIGLGKDANLACFSAATATIPCTWFLENFDDIAHVDGQAMLHLPIPVVNCCVSEGEEKNANKWNKRPFQAN